MERDDFLLNKILDVEPDPLADPEPALTVPVQATSHSPSLSTPTETTPTQTSLTQTAPTQMLLSPSQTTPTPTRTAPNHPP